MTEGFKRLYPKTRVILDCTEIYVRSPSSLLPQSQLYSTYKSNTTLKSNSPEGPSEIEKMWHKVGKTDPLIFRPEITYGMLRIVV